jgi:hypothetical protein
MSLPPKSGRPPLLRSKAGRNWRTDKRIEDADSLETILAQCYETIQSPVLRDEESE